MSIPPPGPLAYEGQVVVPFIVRDFPPTTAFNQFSVPTIWIEPTAENAYILTGKPLGVANWLLFVNGGGNVGTLQGNTGGSVGPTAGGLINVVGDGTTITIAGNPGTNTLTASLVGGGTAIDSITVDAATAPGTNPVVSNGSGLISITGAQVATGTVGANVIRTDSRAANTLTVEVQRSTAVAASDTTKNGVAHFDSAMFTVGAGGFVSLAGGGQAIDSFIPDSGTSPVVPAANGSVTMAGSGSITTVGGLNALTTQLTGLTNHNVLVGAGTATITNVPPSTAGFVLTSNGVAADPSFQSVSASGAITTITGNSGGAETPTAGGNFNILGTGSITVAGSANTETVQLTGLTNHAVLVGAGTATITNIAATANTGAVLQNNSGADPSYSTATYPSTTTINQLLYSSAANTVTGLATANRAVLTTGATGVPVLTALATNGQLIIGSTAGVPAAATLTAGTGVSITNGSNSITISTTGSGFTWTDNSGTFTAAINNGYFLTAASTATLPASPSQGDAVEFICDTTGSCVITANTGQSIRISNQISSVAGTATNSARGDSLSLVYRSATTTWFADASPNGGWTTA